MSEKLEYLVRGALLECSCGSYPRRMNLPKCHGVYIGKNPMVNSGDHKSGDNIQSFGSCKKKDNKPCTPEFAGDDPWQDINSKLIIGDEQKYALTTDSYLECVTGGRITVVTSGQEYEMTSKDYKDKEDYYEGNGYFQMMKDSYGFGEEESRLYLRAYYLLANEAEKRNLEGDKKINFIFSRLASLCDNYDGGEGIRWKLTADIPSTQETMKYLKTLGMSEEEVKTFHKNVNAQHSSAAKKDLPHEWVEYAIFSADSITHNLLDGTIGSLDALGSYKGDVYSTRMNIDDKNSDVDAINTYNIMKPKDGSISLSEEPLDVILEYNKKVETGEINRVDDFLKYYGDGDVNEGLDYIKKDLLKVDIGAQYIAEGSKSVIQDMLYTNAIVRSEVTLTGVDNFNKLLTHTNANQIFNVNQSEINEKKERLKENNEAIREMGIEGRREKKDRLEKENEKLVEDIKKLELRKKRRETMNEFIQYLEDGMSK